MDQYLAEIRPFGGKFAPLGWALCNGALLNITGNEALFGLLGTKFGGNGTTTFGLPDLRGRLPIGSGQGTAPGATNHLFASTGGSESVTLSTAQVPAHNHAFNVTASNATASSPSGNVFANPNPNLFYTPTPRSGVPLQVLNSDSVPVSGGGSASHDNLMPSLVINYIIATTGLYPAQP